MLRSLLFVCMRVFEGQSMIKMHRTSLSVLGRFLFGECEIPCSSVLPLFSLYSPFSAHDPTCLIWTRLKMPQGILHGFSTVSHWDFNKFKKTSSGMRWTRLLSCLGPIRPTNLCNSSLCVSMLCFETVLACITALITNCGPFNRRSSMGV